MCKRSGNPFGVGQTVTSGIVSALGRAGLGINTFENFIQTDAAINPGNSGGALVDAHGSLVGINTAIYSRSGGSMGIGFAIPVSTVRMVMEQIIRTGSVTRGWIGVEAQGITPPLAESFGLSSTLGAIIAGVLRNGPADKAGVRPGDVLVEVNGKPVADPQGMLNLIAALEPGSSARLKLKRREKDVELNVTIGRRPKPQSREAAILMLADSVEASVRSLSSHEEPAIRAMVSQIISDRLIDGQFDECELTLRDLDGIRESFIEQLLAMYHRRIAYPTNQIVELQSRRAQEQKGA